MCKGRSKEASGEAGVEDEKGWVLNALTVRSWASTQGVMLARVVGGGGEPQAWEIRQVGLKVQIWKSVAQNY